MPSPPTSPPAMPTEAGRLRNGEIFQTAAELMVQRGYAGTSVNNLAKAVGMTKAGLYHHISSKQDLLFRILVQAMEVLEEKVIAPARGISDPEERLQETIRLHVRGLFEHGLEHALLFQERRHLEPAQQEIIFRRVKGYLEFLRGAMRELASEGKLADLDIDVASRHLLQTIAGIARWYPMAPEIDQNHLVEQTVSFNMSALLKHRH